MARELQIQFCTISDGSRIAYTVLGEGSWLAFPAWWVNHLEVLWEHLTARSFFERLARAHKVVIYDRQGCGLSDRGRTDYSLESDLRTLETVIDHLQIKRAVLLGFSHGAPPAIAYAAKYPPRVSDLILFGMLDRPLFQGEVGVAVAGLIRRTGAWGRRRSRICSCPAPIRRRWSGSRAGNRKLGVRGRAEATAYALRRGVVQAG